ncbi:hypothetical protein HW555_002393 [Spodoptera exigua]|uniref:Uncharacterized protein n=1 Tax=Spodoptera exigua TaxID=7107 RepID=A0A835GM79_SPOEX|nr:hypothetical protein HW555_002393 [Spodoptera exigua]
MELIKQFLAELGGQIEPEGDFDEEMEYQSASPVQREADSTEARQVSEYMKKIKSFFIEHRNTSELQNLKRSKSSSSSEDEEYPQPTERRKKRKAALPADVKPRRFLTARSTMPVIVTELDDRPLPSRSNQ